MKTEKNSIVAYMIMHWKKGVHTWELDKQDKAHPGAFLYCVDDSDPELPEFEPYEWIPDTWLVIEQLIKIHGLFPSITYDSIGSKWLVSFWDDVCGCRSSSHSESFCEAVCEAALYAAL